MVYYNINDILINTDTGSIIRILSTDYDHHKGFTEYHLFFYTYCPITNKVNGEMTWVRNGFFSDKWVKVSPIQEAVLRILYE